MAAFFVRPCPGCKKRVSVRIKHLGKKVRCVKCQTVFRADDPQLCSASLDDPINYWIDYTDRGVASSASGERVSQEVRNPR